MSVATLLALFSASLVALLSYVSFGRGVRGVAPAHRALALGFVLVGLALVSDRRATFAPSSPTSIAAVTEQGCATPGASACALRPSTPVAQPAELPPGPHLIEFLSGHCRACARVAPVLAELEQRCTHGDGAILRVNVDEPLGEALADRYAVRAVPTFIQVDADGGEVERVVGAPSRSELALALANVRGEACVVL